MLTFKDTQKHSFDFRCNSCSPWLQDSIFCGSVLIFKPAERLLYRNEILKGADMYHVSEEVCFVCGMVYTCKVMGEFRCQRFVSSAVTVKPRALIMPLRLSLLV